jgi:hypothetical protein
LERYLSHDIPKSGQHGRGIVLSVGHADLDNGHRGSQRPKDNTFGTAVSDRLRLERDSESGGHETEHGHHATGLMGDIGSEPRLAADLIDQVIETRPDIP